MSVIVKNISKIYGQQYAVHQLSFSVAKGEILGFLGPNGAGKSTTMKIITGFIPQSSGEVSISGFDTIQNLSEVKKKIGYLPESNPLYPDLYIKEYLQFIANIHQLGKQAKTRIQEVIEMVGLQKEAGKKIGQLSKGFKQRVGIAQAIIHHPEVLILDEPTSGLDPNQILEIRSLIKTLGKNITIILSSHIMQEVQAVCDKVLIINHGKKVAYDTVDNLLQNINHQQTIIVVFKEKIKKEKLTNQLAHVACKLIDENQWELSTHDKKDLREVVFHFAQKENLTILNLQKVHHNLENIFHQLTQT